MNVNEELQRRIENRDTELQRVYDQAVERREELRNQIGQLQEELLKTERLIRKCRQMAEEQGYPNAL